MARILGHISTLLVVGCILWGLVPRTSAQPLDGYYPCDVCGPTAPHVDVTVDGLYLFRDDSVGGILFTDDLTGDPLLALDDILAQWQSGIRVGLRFFEDDGLSWELVGFGMDDYEASIRRESGNGITFPFFSGVPANPATGYSAEYTAQFHGLELNFRRPLGDRIDVFAGFRFIELSEGFDLIADTSRGFFSAADNDLYGFQLGAETTFWRIGQIDLDIGVKGGVYYNNADVYAEAVNPGNANPIILRDDEDVVAFAGELQVGAVIPMGPQANLRLGYQAFLLDGVGLAPHQSASYSIFTGSGTLDQSTVLFHGGYLGFDIFW